MSCDWRKNISLYADDELAPSAQQEFVNHLKACSECSTALVDQMELKRAVRIAGSRFQPPAELYASIRGRVRPRPRWISFSQRVLLSVSALLLAAAGTFWYSRSRSDDRLTAQLVDQHVTMLASEHPVDVISEDRHTVKPWFQGKLPFTFNLPDPQDATFKLVGGRMVYAEGHAGAELVYQVRQHKISVFIFQAQDVRSHSSGTDRSSAFTVKEWTVGGLQCYLITDANREDAERLAKMLEDANKS